MSPQRRGRAAGFPDRRTGFGYLAAPGGRSPRIAGRRLPVRPPFEHAHRVAGAYGAAGDGHEVLAEDQAAAELAVAGQRPQRLPAALGGVLVGGGHHTAAAGPRDAEDHLADGDARPVVLGPGLGPGHHDAGPEAVHRQRPLMGVTPLGYQGVEGVQGGRRGDEQRIAVGERDRLARQRVVRVDRAAGGRVVQVDQAYVLVEIGAVPGVRLGGGRHRLHLRPEYAHRHGGHRLRHLDRQRLPPGRGQTHTAAGQWLGGGECEARMLPLGDDLPLGVDQCPAPVSGQAPGLHHGGRGREAPESLDRVEVDRLHFGDIHVAIVPGVTDSGWCLSVTALLRVVVRVLVGRLHRPWRGRTHRLVPGARRHRTLLRGLRAGIAARGARLLRDVRRGRLLHGHVSLLLRVAVDRRLGLRGGRRREGGQGRRQGGQAAAGVVGGGDPDRGDLRGSPLGHQRVVDGSVPEGGGVIAATISGAGGGHGT
ncbi:hypothetical protein SGPA1_20961 [Streptomyces misionensis JCM 4497]